jgi:pyridoxal phosphate enzyme (YggS family)
MSIKDNLIQILNTIPEGVKLIVVSKTRTNEELMEVYNAGLRSFGENKVQELLLKQQELPKDIEWHLIGHLQTNKVKAVIPFVSLIHSADSLKLLKVLDRESRLAGKIVNCLLQVHIAKEETKFGFSVDELLRDLNSEEYKSISNVKIKGLMGMATFTDNQNQVREEFKSLRTIFDQLKTGFFKENQEFKELSMGMSDDYPIAIEEGSTLVRIGSKIFGPRIYTNQ